MSSSFTAFHRGGSGPPLLCLHGITDTWRTWELVMPALEREHEVFAPTLTGHAGGPAIDGEVTDSLLADAVERAMDEAGIETAHVVGNSLGGFVALQLASRGRAESVVALAPAGGWEGSGRIGSNTIAYFLTMRDLVQSAAPHADAIAATPEGRRRATAMIATNFEHIPADLIAHQIRGAAGCEGLDRLIEYSVDRPWPLEAEKITCPLRIVWGTDDKILRWPSAAERYRDDLFPDADWVVLDGIGHCPHLDVPTETAELILGVTAR